MVRRMARNQPENALPRRLMGRGGGGPRYVPNGPPPTLLMRPWRNSVNAAALGAASSSGLRVRIPPGAPNSVSPSA